MAGNGFERIREHPTTVVFVISTGRTGTQALARCLDEAFHDVTALHEPRPSYRLRLASNAYRAGQLSERRMAQILLRSRSRLCRDVREPVYVESNPYLHGFVEILPRVFRNPKLVHVVRDPRTYVRSAVNFGTFGGLKMACGKLVKYWLLRPEDTGEDLGRPSKTTPLEHFSWGWRYCNEKIAAASELYGTRYLRRRYEDLFAPSGDGIRELGRWIGLEEVTGRLDYLISERINPSRSRTLPPWEEWPREDRERLLAQCGPLMRKFGYEIQGCMGE